jgi:hypothetical protein
MFQLARRIKQIFRKNKTRKNNKKILIGGLIIILFVFFYFILDGLGREKGGVDNNLGKEEVNVLPETKTEEVLIVAGDTYGVAMARSGLDQKLINDIYEAAKDVYDLAQIRADYKLEFIYGYQDNKLQKFVYKIDTEKELSVEISEEG